MPRTFVHESPAFFDLQMPVQAVAKTVEGWRRSRVRVITSESLIIPCWIGRQLRPALSVRQASRAVPTMMLASFLGSIATEPTSLSDVCSRGEMREKVSAPSDERKTPSLVTTAKTLGLEADRARPRTASRSRPAPMIRNETPRSELFATPPPVPSIFQKAAKISPVSVTSISSRLAPRRGKPGSSRVHEAPEFDEA